MWTLIKKQTGKSHISDQNIVLKTDPEKIINQQNVADRLNSVFVDCAEDHPVQNKPYVNGQTSQMKIKNNSNAMFVCILTEDKLNKVVCKFKGKTSTGFDQIPEFLVKKLFSTLVNL